MTIGLIIMLIEAAIFVDQLRRAAATRWSGRAVTLVGITYSGFLITTATFVVIAIRSAA